MLLKETKILLKNNIGYRNNAISAISDPSIVEVFEFEINELLNDDILNYMSHNYHLHAIEDIYTYFEKEFGEKRDRLYAFWMASKEAVQDLYSSDEDIMIDSYQINRYKTIIASDIGYDGVLFVSSHYLDEFLIEL